MRKLPSRRRRACKRSFLLASIWSLWRSWRRGRIPSSRPCGTPLSPTTRRLVGIRIVGSVGCGPWQNRACPRRVVVGEWLCSDVVTAFLQILFSIRGYNSIAYSFKELHKSDLVDLRLPWSTRRARVRGSRVYFIRLSIETNSTQGGVRN